MLRFQGPALYKIIFIVIAILIPNFTFADTIIGNDIIKDTTLTKDRNPYIVPQSIDVVANVTLTIESGVTIKFDEGANLNIFGAIVANGTASEMIVFTSNEVVPGEGDWGGIDFHPGSIGTIEDANGDYAGGTIFSHCEFNYATNAIINKYTVNSPGSAGNLHIMNCIFKGSGISSQSSGRCENNSLTDASIGMGGHSVPTSNIIKIKNNNVTNGNIGAGGNLVQVIIQDNKILNGSVQIGTTEDVGNPHIVSGNTIENGYIRTVGSYLEIYNNTINGGTYSASWAGIEMIFGGNNVSIYNNTITNHEDSGIKLTYGCCNTTTITKNIISKNSKHGIENLTYENINIVITENEITNNSGHGILTPNIASFTKNNIHGNTLYDFYYTSIYFNQIATNNYWGTTNSSEISNKIYDYWEDITLGEVIFEPFANSPFVIGIIPLPNIPILLLSP